MLSVRKLGSVLSECTIRLPATDAPLSDAHTPAEQFNWYQSIEDLYQRDRPLMLRVANGLLHNSVDAEDVVQEVFSKLLRLRERNRILTKNYLVAAVRNECLRLLHLRGRLKAIDPADFDEHLAPRDLPAPPLEDLGDLLAMLAHMLPARQNAVVQLRALGASTAEIARALQISAATVRSHLRYAREILTRERTKERRGRSIQPTKTSTQRVDAPRADRQHPKSSE